LTNGAFTINGGSLISHFVLKRIKLNLEIIYKSDQKTKRRKFWVRDRQKNVLIKQKWEFFWFNESQEWSAREGESWECFLEANINNQS